MGSAQLLMSQKFQQFYWLCQQNTVSAFPRGPLPRPAPLLLRATPRACRA